MTRYLASHIKPNDAGATLLNFLAKRFSYYSREQWHDLIRKGLVHLNEQNAEPDSIIKTGMRVCYYPDDIQEPPVDTNINVLCDFKDFIAINKNGNLPCHPNGRYFNNTLWGVLKTRFEIEKPRVINRLDRETSGVCLIARNKDAASRLGKLFRSRAIRKTYIALVHGVFPETFEAIGTLGPDPDSAIRKKVRFVLDASAATHSPIAFVQTRFRRLSHDGKISQIEAEPVTGRTHQIRATLLALGFPIVGDKLYGLDETLYLRHSEGTLTPEDLALLQLPRQALHAHTLEIPLDPPLRVRAPLPADMKNFPA